MNSEKLINICVAQERWAEDAAGVLMDEWDMNAIVADEASRLQRLVIAGSISVGELRAGVSWANALDSEAVLIYGADLSVGEQQAERVGRRMIHLAGRTALNGLSSKRKRLIARVACNHEKNLV